jgi:hypothetical protein
MKDQFTKFGRSGCRLQLNPEGLLIRKTSSSVSYNSRLYTQYIKQKAFIPTENFVAPIVDDFNKNGDLHFFDMEYIYGKSFDQFCIDSNVKEIQCFANCLVSFIKNNLQKSIWTNIDFSFLEKKLLLLKAALEPSFHGYVDFLLNNKVLALPIGFSHGDLTMSNMIFSNKYYVLDFLDNIFETPLNDIIKVRQDTQHKFYLNFLEKNNTKIETCLDYIDSQIELEFKELVATNEYVWLSIFSLLRVLPYLKQENERLSIQNGLKKYEHFIASSR